MWQNMQQLKPKVKSNAGGLHHTCCGRWWSSILLRRLFLGWCSIVSRFQPCRRRPAASRQACPVAGGLPSSACGLLRRQRCGSVFLPASACRGCRQPRRQPNACMFRQQQDLMIRWHRLVTQPCSASLKGVDGTSGRGCCQGACSTPSCKLEKKKKSSRNAVLQPTAHPVMLARQQQQRVMQQQQCPAWTSFRGPRRRCRRCGR